MSAGSIDIWGPACWKFLHASSFAYPESADPVRQAGMLEFLKSLGSALPCATCREHYNDYIEKNLDTHSVASREAIIAFIVELHNDVNRRTGKPEWAIEQVRMHYESKGPSSSCPVVKRETRPIAWIITVVVVALLGLVVASQLRRVPN